VVPDAQIVELRFGLSGAANSTLALFAGWWRVGRIWYELLDAAPALIFAMR
jgi:hypothetical protein